MNVTHLFQKIEKLKAENIESIEKLYKTYIKQNLQKTKVLSTSKHVNLQRTKNDINKTNHYMFKVEHLQQNKSLKHICLIFNYITKCFATCKIMTVKKYDITYITQYNLKKLALCCFKQMYN